MDQATNHRQYVIYWYQSNNVGFIQNIDIWLSYGPNKARMLIFGHTFFGHNSAILRSWGLKFLMGAQETIIYRLVVRNPSYYAYFWFLATFLPENERGYHAPPNGLGPPNAVKKLAHWWTLHTFIRTWV